MIGKKSFEERACDPSFISERVAGKVGRIKLSDVLGCRYERIPKKDLSQGGSEGSEGGAAWRSCQNSQGNATRRETIATHSSTRTVRA